MQNKQEWGFTVPHLSCVDVPRIIREALEGDPDVQVIFVSNRKAGQGFCLTPLANAVSRGLDCRQYGFIVEESEVVDHPVFGLGFGPGLVREYPEAPVPFDEVLHANGRPWVMTAGELLDQLVYKHQVRVELF